jgi:hypothetical protein
MIAISYRREDSSPVTGRLFDRLQAEFGRRNVFMDFDSIPFGVDFRDKIKITLERARVVVAVVGPGWMGNREGKRRIDDPTDFVRIEIAAALQRGIPVIPVLLDHTVMPAVDELPEELRPFAFRNALVLDTGVDFHHHASRLISGIHEIVDGRPSGKRKGRGMMAGIILVLLALIATGIWWSGIGRRNTEPLIAAPVTPAAPATETPLATSTPTVATTTPSKALSSSDSVTPRLVPTPASTTAPSASLPVPIPSDLKGSVAVPPNFTRIAPRVAASSRTIVNERFQSADGAVQFAITAIRVGDLAPTIEARAIAIPRLEGEAITERIPSRDNLLHHEDVTVEGPHRSYTRYFAIDVSTSTSADASSRLWEFWVRDDRALQTYKDIYRAFKKSVKF